MELVDLLNNRKELIGETCERNSVPEGKYRLSIHIWIVNDKNEILIQQRSASRKMFPNMWTNTGGACIAGETSIETVFRELQEELNVIPNIDNLELIASYKRKKDYVDVWLLKQNINIKDLKFNDNEVQAAKWASIEEWKKLLIEEQAVKSSTDYFLNYINNEF
ncbi:MAG TPA: NUDIX domain-containing protein [Candidatus Faecisoma merdavium]|nr:NUDIX domain-containing protein [Candidatus Faecisoma merdavium]